MTTSFISATEATARFASGELSPVELLDAVLARADTIEPQINAFTEEHRDQAYRAARESERRFREGTQRPLEGIPLALKDEQPVKGLLQEDGSLLCKGEIAEFDHPVVERVRDAGAVIHARTTTPEFCAAAVTHSNIWGITRNPHNLEFSPGGSSGGSGAALAAGTTVLATGSDIAGSIRMPSAFCGTVGYKPPYARVPGIAPFNSDSYCADGPMGRTVADVAALQNVLVGQWPGDPASLRENPVLAPVAASLAGTRIALSLNLGAFNPDPAIVANTLAFADALRAAGAIVDEVHLPWTPEQITNILMAHFNAIMGASVDLLVDGDPDRFSQLMPYTRAFAERTASAKLSYIEGLIAEHEFYLPLGQIFEQYDALVCPTLANTGLAADDPCTDTDHMLDAMMTTPFNIAGRVPVLSVPSGRAPNGVPTGVQIVARPYDDETVFRIGAAVEAELSLWTSQDWWPAR